MVADDKKISYRIYLVAFTVIVMAILIVVKLTNIQWIKGDYFRELAKQRTVRNFTIPANRGNVYSADGSLLATSIPNYTIRFDALAPKKEDFDENIAALADSLSLMLGQSSAHYENKLNRARAVKNRYFFITRGLSYTQYMRIKRFPLFNKGPYRGGFIAEQKTIREHPIGKIAERTIGYERMSHSGKNLEVGIEGAFAQYLNGTDGKRMMQKIAKSQWKPISDNNEVEPVDGYDIVSTIDVYIQDIAHHALLKQLEYYDADHGCVVVMETKTGYVKAISNLGRARDSSYYETINYAVGESQEPGSTFKLAALMALLEDKKADTSTVYDTFEGQVTYYNRKVRDSRKGGYGKISLARGFEVSSNTVLVQAIYDAYNEAPEAFLQHVANFGLDKPLGVSIIGEGKPKIPYPDSPSWSKLSLPWMGFGYGVSMTPLQTLAFYNAVANNGEMVRPLFVKEIKEWNKTIKYFDKEVISSKICSQGTINKVQDVLRNVVKRGTGSKLYSPNFSMAGKTGTAQVNYGRGKGDNMYYSSSFVGYFPADEPQYSCIVVIHKPSIKKGYYGADVSGPVFKRIAQKIYTDVPSTNQIKKLDKKIKSQEQQYASYYKKAQNAGEVMPNLVGMSGMDAVALLGNWGLKFKCWVTGALKSNHSCPDNY